MRRRISWLLCLCLLACLTACGGKDPAATTAPAETKTAEGTTAEAAAGTTQAGTEPAATEGAAAGLKAGDYESTVSGHNAPMTVKVTVSETEIVSVEVTEDSETAGIGKPALEQVAAEVVDNQSVAVDTITGATVSSAAMVSAVKDCLTQAGANLEDWSEQVSRPGLEREYNCDVLVIGAGGSGLTAAVRAAEQGAKVILIEKTGFIGGVTILNAGTMIATGSRIQTDVLKEDKDTPKLAYDDIMRIGSNVNDPVMVELVVNHVGECIDWLTDDLGIAYDAAATQYPDHSASRQIGVVGRSISYLEQMEEKLKGFGGELYVNTRATSLLTDESGAVTGAKATDVNGEETTFHAASVVLACSGFGANQELLPESLSGYLFYGRDSETGDGLAMALKLGADTINLDCVKVYPQGVEKLPTKGLAATASSTAATAGHGAIYVNSAGERVVSEVASLGELTAATVGQEDKILYIVMDEDAYATYLAKSVEDKLIPSEDAISEWYKVQNNGKPVIVQGDDLAALAEQMGIDGEQLLKTVEEYNAMCANGEDTAFGKADPVALKEGSYVIVEQKPRFQTTLGGLKANEQLQILNEDGEPIANLYGAGCVVGGANGADSMTAMMNTWANFSGYVAGAEAAANAVK